MLLRTSPALPFVRRCAALCQTSRLLAYMPNSCPSVRYVNDEMQTQREHVNSKDGFDAEAIGVTRVSPPESFRAMPGSHLCGQCHHSGMRVSACIPRSLAHLVCVVCRAQAIDSFSASLILQQIVLLTSDVLRYDANSASTNEQPSLCSHLVFTDFHAPWHDFCSVRWSHIGSGLRIETEDPVIC